MGGHAFAHILPAWFQIISSRIARFTYGVEVKEVDPPHRTLVLVLAFKGEAIQSNEPRYTFAAPAKSGDIPVFLTDEEHDTFKIAADGKEYDFIEYNERTFTRLGMLRISDHAGAKVKCSLLFGGTSITACVHKEETAGNWSTGHPLSITD
jgi:hypothetical protein